MLFVSFTTGRTVLRCWLYPRTSRLIWPARDLRPRCQTTKIMPNFLSLSLSLSCALLCFFLSCLYTFDHFYPINKNKKNGQTREHLDYANLRDNLFEWTLCYHPKHNLLQSLHFFVFFFFTKKRHYSNLSWCLLFVCTLHLLTRI